MHGQERAFAATLSFKLALQKSVCDLPGLQTSDIHRIHIKTLIS